MEIYNLLDTAKAMIENIRKQMTEPTKKYKFKEVEILPEYSDSIACNIKLVANFMESGIGISDITEYCKSKDSNNRPLTSGFTSAIRRMGISNKVFVTIRRKRLYIVNIEKTGLRRAHYRSNFGFNKRNSNLQERGILNEL